MSENSLEERYCQGTEVTASLGQEQQILVAEFGVTQDPGHLSQVFFFFGSPSFMEHFSPKHTYTYKNNRTIWLQ